MTSLVLKPLCLMVYLRRSREPPFAGNGENLSALQRNNLFSLVSESLPFPGSSLYTTASLAQHLGWWLLQFLHSILSIWRHCMRKLICAMGAGLKSDMIFWGEYHIISHHKGRAQVKMQQCSNTDFSTHHCHHVPKTIPTRQSPPSDSK